MELLRSTAREGREGWVRGSERGQYTQLKGERQAVNKAQSEGSVVVADHRVPAERKTPARPRATWPTRHPSGRLARSRGRRRE